MLRKANSRRVNDNIDASLSQTKHVRDQLGLENTAEDWVALFRWAQVESLDDNGIISANHHHLLRFVITSQSSLRFDIETLFIVTRLIFRSKVVIV